MARLSIVIPVLGKLQKLEDTLVSVLENRPAHCEIVVVLNEPYDDPYELAGEVDFVQAPPRAGMIECLNLGIAASRSPIVHLLGCGTEVTPGWTDAALPHFEDCHTAAVAVQILDRADLEHTLSTGVGYRPGGAAWRLGYRRSIHANATKMPAFFGPDLIAGFYRRSALEAVGGFSSAFPRTLAAVDMALAIHFAAGRCVAEPNCRVLAEVSDLPEGERLGGGCKSERLFWRWARYMGWFRASVGHAALIMTESLQCVVHPTNLFRLFGRAWESMWIPLRGRNEWEANTDLSRETVISRPHFRQNCPMEISKAS